MDTEIDPLDPSDGDEGRIRGQVIVPHTGIIENQDDLLYRDDPSEKTLDDFRRKLS